MRSRLILFGLGGVVLCIIALPLLRWTFGPPPAVQEIRQSTSVVFPTRFPIRLTRPGHYRLMSDLVVPGRDTDAIQILTFGVVLDLNGFTIAGPHQGGSGRGVSTGDIDRGYITVRNGTIRGFGSDGIQLRGLSHRVEDVYTFGNGGDGIEVGPNSVLIRNLARDNGGSGLNVDRGESLILSNTAQGNRCHGIDGGGTSWVSGNLIEDNTGEGLFLTIGSLATKNVVRRSGRNGLLLGTFVTAEENEVHGSREAGIMTYGKSNRLIGNTVKENHGPGAKLGGPDNYVARNRFQGNGATALTSAADDHLGQDEEANMFLLPSGEQDVAGVARQDAQPTDGWSR